MTDAATRLAPATTGALLPGHGDPRAVSGSTVRGASPDEAPARPRRILYVEANEDGTVGGSHQILFDLVTHIDRVRYEPVVLLYQDSLFAPKLRAEGIEVHLFEAERRIEREANLSGSIVRKCASFVQAIGRRVDTIRTLQADAVHLNNSPFIALDDWLPACRRAGVPCISTAAGDARRATAFGRGEGTWLHRRLLRSFDAYLPMSRYVADALRAAGGPEGRMRIVYPGVDVDAIRERVTRERDAMRAALGVGASDVMAVMVGNIREWKGQHVVLEALRLVSPDVRQTLRVYFAGAKSAADEAYGARLESMVREYGLTGSVTFLGPRRDVADLFAAADIALHASVLPEPWGLVVLEALALGRPIIAANSGGPLEIVTPQVGVLFDTAHPEQMATALDRLVREPTLRATMGAEALKRAREFSIRQNTDDTVRVYEDVFGQAR